MARKVKDTKKRIEYQDDMDRLIAGCNPNGRMTSAHDGPTASVFRGGVAW